MPNYKETSGVGTSYVRCKEVVLRNELNGVKGAAFIEELAINFDGGVIKQPTGGMFCEFSEINANTVFPLLDMDGNPTGEEVSFAHVYAVILSLYYYQASKRDAAEAAPTVKAG